MEVSLYKLCIHVSSRDLDYIFVSHITILCIIVPSVTETSTKLQGLSL